MIDNCLRLTDPNFSPEAAKNCVLLLKIAFDSFSYAIVDENTQQVCVVFDQQGCADVAKSLQAAFKNDPLLKLNYHEVKAAVYTKHFIFVPDAWLDENNLQNYQQFLGTQAPIKLIEHSDFNFKTLFSLNEDLLAQLPQHAVVYPQSEPLLALFDYLSADALLIDFTAESFNVLFIQDRKFQFQNHYQAENTDEFNYFLLLMIEQLKLSKNTPVYLQGIINEDDDYHQILTKYFNQLYFFLPAGKQDSELLADMPQHYFSGLLAVALCE